MRTFFSLVLLAISLQAFSIKIPDCQKSDVTGVMKKVADWQIAHQREVKHSPTHWGNAALYIGMYKWAEIAEMGGDNTYFNWLNRIGRRNSWQVGPRPYHADDIAVAQMYLNMYRKYKDRKMWLPTLMRAEGVINHPSHGSFELDYGDVETLERWTWCDALFMAPPVYTQLYMITGDKKFIKFMNKEYKASYDYLYDKEDSLFYRDWRYFDQKEANGKKIFWSRGNGWVMAGLCEILKELPLKDSNRKFYHDLLVRMSYRVIDLQQPDGFWRASLLDPDSYNMPESSGTAFFVYALAYAVNEGILPEEDFMPHIIKGWQALLSTVEEDGKLGFVQPIGADPKAVTREMTETYGVGAFLMAGSEIWRMGK